MIKANIANQMKDPLMMRSRMFWVSFGRDFEKFESIINIRGMAITPRSNMVVKKETGVNVESQAGCEERMYILDMQYSVIKPNKIASHPRMAINRLCPFLDQTIRQRYTTRMMNIKLNPTSRLNQDDLKLSKARKDKYGLLR